MIFIGLILSNVTSYTQNSREVSLTSLLQELSEISKIKITYSPTITNEVFPQDYAISAAIEISLDKLLRNTGLKFKRIKDYYVVYGTPKKKIEKIKPRRAVKAEKVVVVKENYKRELFIPNQILSQPVPMVAVEPLSMAKAITIEYIPFTPAMQIKTEGQYPSFALKTNLLYDAISAVNVGAEISVNPRYSVSGNVVFPWWVQDNGRIDSKRNRLQLFSATIEGRYWFGSREGRPNLTGWFVGLYAGGGYFDLERNGNGIQGDHLFFGGASLGYVQRLNKRGNFRIEYSLGIGYLQTNYQKYKSFFRENHQCEIKTNHNWHPERKESGRYKWIGPANPEISFVWIFNAKK